jgi:pimeloyl-ACP methyl ester carboxylesterase
VSTMIRRFAAPLCIATIASLVLTASAFAQSAPTGTLPPPSAQAATWEPTLSGAWESLPGGPEVAYICYGEGTPVVVVEAGSDSSGIESYGRPFMEPLAARTTVCTYDRLGTGSSDVPTDEVRTLDDTSAVLEGLLDSLPFEPPYVLVGQSAGGNFQIDYAAKHPDQVAGLVLIEAYHDDPDGFAAWVEQEGIDPADNPERLDWLDGSRRLDDLALPFGEFPVLVISATDADPGNVENQAYWLAISPNSEQVVLEGSHDLQWDDPAGVAALIVKVLDSL